jgi:hypothetical protein
MSASFDNYSGGTFLSDLVTRPEFLQYTSEGIFNQSKWIQSGIVARNAALDARAGGTRVQVPFFDPIAPTEEQITSASNWGTGGNGYLTPQKTTADQQIMTILHRGFAYAADDLSMLGSGADPLGHVRNQLTAAINKLKTATLLAQLNGLFGLISGAGVLGANQINKTGTTTAAEANYVSAANVIAARNLLGERGYDLDTIAMHSNVYSYLMQVGALTFSTSALAAAGAVTWGGGGVGLTSSDVAYFCGLRVVVDDQIVALTGGTSTHLKKYPVYLFKSGVISEGVQQDLRLAADRNILSMQDVIAVDYHYGYHIAGTKWAANGDNPSNASSTGNLAATASWNLVYSTTQMVPITRLLVNTPFDTTTY